MALAERTEGQERQARDVPPATTILAARARAWPRPRITARGSIIAALLVFTLVKQLILVAAYPPFQGHDEVGHYGNLWTMEHFGRLPTLGDNMPVILDPYSSFTLDWPAVYTANHPPLYYLLTYRIMLAAGSDGPEGLLPRMYALRLASIVPFLLAIWLTYLLTRVLFPRDPFLTLTVPAAVAFGPQLSFEGAIINNDIFSILWGALILYLCAAALRHGLTWRRACLLGVALGSGLLVKATLTALLPLAAFVAIWCRWPRPWGAIRTRDYWRGLRGPAAALIAPALLIPAPWYAYMYRTYGDFSAFRAIQALQAGWNVPAGTFAELLFSREFHTERIKEYVGYWGWRLIPLTTWQERLTYAALILAGGGLVVGIGRLAWGWLRERRRPETLHVGGVGLIILANLAMYGATIYFGTMFLLTQARYFFPVAGATALLGLLGVRALLPERALRPAAAITIAAFAAFNLWLLFGSVLPYAFF